MREPSSLENRCRFDTERLSVQGWHQFQTESAEENTFAEIALEVLSDEATKFLPDGWQYIDTIEKAKDWFEDRLSESSCFLVEEKTRKKIIGFVFLYEIEAVPSLIELRLGFLLAESTWGKGFGSELISGLVDWCKNDPAVKSLSGGVEPENFGSAKVLEKSGFKRIQADTHEDTTIFFELTVDER